MGEAGCQDGPEPVTFREMPLSHSPNKAWWEKKERGFMLDSVAVSWAGIPPYNPQLDPATKTYFTKGVKIVLRKTKQNRGGTSQLGWLYDQRYASTTGARYLRERARQYKGGYDK